MKQIQKITILFMVVTLIAQALSSSVEHIYADTVATSESEQLEEGHEYNPIEDIISIPEQGEFKVIREDQKVEESIPEENSTELKEIDSNTESNKSKDEISIESPIDLSGLKNESDRPEISFFIDTFASHVNQSTAIQIVNLSNRQEFNLRIPAEMFIDISNLSNEFTITNDFGEYWNIKTEKNVEIIDIPLISKTSGSFFISVDDDAAHMFLNFSDYEGEISKNEIPVKALIDTKLSLPVELIKEEESRILENMTTIDGRNTSNWSQFRSAWNSSSTNSILLSTSITYSSSILGSSLNTRKNSITLSSFSTVHTLNMGTSGNRLAMTEGNLNLNRISIESESTLSATLSLVDHSGSGSIILNSSTQIINRSRGTAVSASGTAQIIQNDGIIMNEEAHPPVSLITNSSYTLNKGVVGSSGVSSSIVPPISTTGNAKIYINANNEYSSVQMLGRIKKDPVSNQITLLDGFSTGWNYLTAQLSGPDGTIVESSSSIPDDFETRYLNYARSTAYRSLMVDPSGGIISTYSFSMEATPQEGGSPTSTISGILVPGAITEISANPVSGYNFSHWEIVSGTGRTIGNPTSANTTFRMGSGNTVIRAVYTPNTYSLTLEASPDIGGNPTVESDSIISGGTTTLTANPASGYSFIRWEIISGTGASIADPTSANTTFRMGSGDAVVRAVYELNTYYSLALEASPASGGNPTAGSGSIVQGGTTILTANPASGYSFIRWEIISGTGASIADPTSASTTFRMGSGDAVVRAVYELNTHSLALEASPAAGGNPSANSTTIVQGETTSISANPSTGYRFSRWEIISGIDSSIANMNNTNTTFTMGSSDTTIRAVYDIEQVSPKDPLNPEIEVDPENKPDLPENQGLFSIDFASSFSFGEQIISVQDQIYFSQPQRLADDSNNVEAKLRPNYVQISDRRPAEEREGWNLAVTQEKQFFSTNGHELSGAQLILNNQQLATSNGEGEPTIVHNDGVELISGIKQSLLSASADEGTGTWIYRFGDRETADSSVALFVPQGANPQSTTYRTKLNWELSSIPKNE